MWTKPHLLLAKEEELGLRQSVLVTHYINQFFSLILVSLSLLPGSTDAMLDLGSIPHTNPSLGRDPGHARRDLVTRSSVKRRPPSHRAALLLTVIVFINVRLHTLYLELGILIASGVVSCCLLCLCKIMGVEVIIMFTTCVQVDDSQKMGTKRVDLSACSPTHHPPTHTTPEKV